MGSNLTSYKSKNERVLLLWTVLCIARYVMHVSLVIWDRKGTRNKDVICTVLRICIYKIIKNWSIRCPNRTQIHQIAFNKAAQNCLNYIFQLSRNKISIQNKISKMTSLKDHPITAKNPSLFVPPHFVSSHIGVTPYKAASLQHWMKISFAMLFVGYFGQKTLLLFIFEKTL